MNIGNVKMLSFLWLALVPVLFYLWARYRRKRAMRLFIKAGLLNRICLFSFTARLESQTADN